MATGAPVPARGAASLRSWRVRPGEACAWHGRSRPASGGCSWARRRPLSRSQPARRPLPVTAGRLGGGWDARALAGALDAPERRRARRRATRRWKRRRAPPPGRLGLASLLVVLALILRCCALDGGRATVASTWGGPRGGSGALEGTGYPSAVFRASGALRDPATRRPTVPRALAAGRDRPRPPARRLTGGRRVAHWPVGSTPRWWPG